VTDELALLDATAQADLVRTRQVTAAELVTAAIERIEALNPVLNAVVTPVFDRAVQVARSGPSGPFAGVPYLLKDLACEMEGVRFTEGSVFLAGHISAFDSELVVRLRQAGLVILGKTNTPEFGMAPACEPVLFGPARNPWDPERSTSGSSGGSAPRWRRAWCRSLTATTWAVPCGIRRRRADCSPSSRPGPATRSGPSTGDVAAGGAAEHALTRSVRDSAALLDATSGPDAGDPYWAPPQARPFRDEVGADPGRLRIAYTTRTPDGDPGHPDCVAAAEHAARLCASLGHEVTETGWPGFTPEIGAAIGTMMNAAAAWIMRYWIRRVGREPGDGEIEPLNRALWQAGEKVTAAEWLLAIEDIQRFSRVVARFLTGFDVFLTPTMSHRRRCPSGRWPRRQPIRGDRSRSAARPCVTRASSPTSPVTRRCPSRSGGATPACRSARTSSAGSATRPRSSGWRRSSRRPSPGPAAGPPGTQPGRSARPARRRVGTAGSGPDSPVEVSRGFRARSRMREIAALMARVTLSRARSDSEPSCRGRPPSPVAARPGSPTGSATRSSTRRPGCPDPSA